MQHSLCIEFFKYWQQRRGETGLPTVADQSDESFLPFKQHYMCFKLKQADIAIVDASKVLRSLLPDDVEISLLTDLYAPALKPMHMALIMPCFQKKAGFSRTSRVCYGHRHKVVEWLYLPVRDAETEECCLEGIIVSATEFHEDDQLINDNDNNSAIERILTHNFMSCEQKVNIATIDQHVWAVLDAMGAKVMVDGNEQSVRPHGLGGNAALLAAQTARSNVLMVADLDDIGPLSRRLTGQYNMRFCHSYDDACGILKNDMVDVLIVAESFAGGTGLELVQEAQTISSFTASVLMLDKKANREDMRIVENGKFVQCLVKPVGEFALKKVLDDAAEHISGK